MADVAVAGQRTMGTREWAMLLLLGAIWGGSFFFAAIAVRDMSPVVLVLVRVALAAAALWIYVLIRGFALAQLKPFLLAFLGLALLNNAIPHTLMFTGQTAIGAGLASVLNATTPFWTMLLANALLPDEKMTARRAVGVVLGVAGTAVLVGPGLIAHLGGPAWAKFALLGTALSYAFAGIFARRFASLPPELVATGQLTAATVIMLPVVFLFDDPAGALSAGWAAWSAAIALALLATSFAYVIFFNLIASAGASNTSLVTLVVPVSAILLGTIFLGERLEIFELGGMALIALGLLVIDGRFFRR